MTAVVAQENRESVPNVHPDALWFIEELSATGTFPVSGIHEWIPLFPVREFLVQRFHESVKSLDGLILVHFDIPDRRLTVEGQ